MRAIFHLIGFALLFNATLFAQTDPMNSGQPGHLLSRPDNFSDKHLLLDKFKFFENNSFLDFYRPRRIETDTTQYFFTYDGNGKLLTQIIQYWVNSNWENSSRSTYTYDNNGKQIIALGESWTGSAWENYSRENFSYDNNGYLITYVYERWANGAWMNDIRENYTYDNNGRKLTEIFENWFNGEWTNVSRYTHSYDGNGNLTMTVFELWTGENWENTKRYQYVYANNLLIEALDENWSPIPNFWVNNLRWQYTYNNEKLINSTLTMWTGSWVNKERFTHTYNNEGRVHTKIREIWWDNSWLNDYRLIYVYDDIYGNLATWIYQDWWQGDWYDLYKAEYIYDNNNNGIRGEYYELDNVWFVWVPTIGHLNIQYNYGIDQMNFTCKWVDVEYDMFTDVDEMTINKFTYSLENNYPNPFNPETTIKFSVSENSNIIIKVFDILGKEIETLVNEERHPGIYEITWNASDIPSGVYYYRMQSGSFIETKKMILLK